MPATVRCVRTCYVDILQDGIKQERLLTFGTWLRVKCVELCKDEGFINVVLDDGSAICGIHRSVFELNNAPIVQEAEIEPEELQEPPASKDDVKLDEPIRIAIDIIGNKEPDCG